MTFCDTVSKVLLLNGESMRILGFVLFFMSELIFAQPKTRYVIGVEAQNYLPYFRTEGKTYLGFSRELFDMFGEYAQIQFEYC